MTRRRRTWQPGGNPAGDPADTPRPKARRKDCAALLLAGALAATAGAAAATGDHKDDLLEAGRRIYIEGVLPDGSPLQATRAGSVVLQGRNAACVTCLAAKGHASLLDRLNYVLTQRLR